MRKSLRLISEAPDKRAIACAERAMLACSMGTRLRERKNLFSSVASRGGQPERLLNRVVNGELAGDDAPHMREPCLQPHEEPAEALARVDAPGHGPQPRLRALAVCLVGFCEDHVPGLRGDARDHGSEGCAAKRDGQRRRRGALASLLPDRLFKRVEKRRDEVEGDLLGHGVRDLFGEHGPEAGEHGQEPILPHELGQRVRQPVRERRVAHHSNPRVFTRAKYHRGNGTRNHGSEQKVQEFRRRELTKNRFEKLVKPEFESTFNAIAHNSRCEPSGKDRHPLLLD
mmetsp:Transcript_29569/g.59379  ORF Transcript_29569/g.59379 Transcript_29569/m.59379 type:complete len:285 (-) Transcript_29569:292-1146(-)